MMRIIKKRYGGYASVACQSGAMWMGAQPTADYIYNFDFSATVQTFVPSTLSPVSCDRIGDKFYLINGANLPDLYYADAATPWNTTVKTGWSMAGAGGTGDIATDGTYIYRCAGINELNRMALPHGTISLPSTSPTLSRANAVVCIDGYVIVASQYNGLVQRSSDYGVTWVSGATSPIPFLIDYFLIAADPSSSRIVCLYKLSTGYYEIKYSDDYGDSWSAVTHSFLDAGGAIIPSRAFTFARGAYRYMTTSGKNGYSADGGSWTSGVDVPHAPDMASYGVGKTIAVCGNNRTYQSVNNGGSWTLVTLPEATPSGGAGFYARTVWIGNDLPACPTLPAGNVWLTTDGNSGESFIGNYEGSSWASIGYIGQALAQIRRGSKIYRYVFASASVEYADVSDLSSWTLIPTLNNSIGFPYAIGGRLIADGAYLYAAGYSIGSLERSAFPSGSFIDVSGQNADARGSGLSLHNGYLYSVQNGSSKDVFRSADQGASWVLIGSIAEFPAYEVFFASNGSRLVAFYTKGSFPSAAYTQYSDDDGATWSTPVAPFAASSAVDSWGTGALYDGTHFVWVLQDGNTAYSTTGGSWTLGANVTGGLHSVTNVARGIGKLVAGCTDNQLYQSTNHGASWAPMTTPFPPSSNSNYVAWVGENP